ncbi:hypothetical protein DFH06DRAFT_1292505 [Mycena polygramma]|nr:hypothetical protein DFH06DRAFT_1292505 [Mycena polygramma]
MSEERDNSYERVDLVTFWIFRRVLDLPQGEMMQRERTAGVQNTAEAKEVQENVSGKSPYGREQNECPRRSTSQVTRVLVTGERIPRGRGVACSPLVSKLPQISATWLGTTVLLLCGSQQTA